MASIYCGRSCGLALTHGLYDSGDAIAVGNHVAGIELHRRTALSSRRGEQRIVAVLHQLDRAR